MKFKDHSFRYDAHIFEQMNIYKLLNIYGYGNCKHYAILFKFMMDIMRVDCKMIYVNTKKKIVMVIILIMYLILLQLIRRNI